MTGTLDIDKPQIMPLAEKSLNYTVYDTQWIPNSKRFVTIGSHPNGTGALEIFDMLPNEKSSFSINLSAQLRTETSLSVGTFNASPMSNRRLATADYAGKIVLHDLDRLGLQLEKNPERANNNNSTTWSATHNKSKKSIIKSLVGCGGVNVGAGPNELASGAEDGIVNIWDLRQPGEPVLTITPANSETPETANIPSLKNTPSRACWSLAFGNSFSDSERALTAGYDNGDVKMFDLRTRSEYWSENVKNGVVDLEFDRRDIKMNKLAAVTLEGNVHTWDTRNLSDKDKEFARVTEIPHTSTAWRVRHLPQNRDVFAHTSGSGKVYLWKYKYPDKRVNENGDAGVPGELEKLQEMALSTQPITGLDWHRGKLGLGVASSLDQCVRIFIASRLNTI